MKKIMVACDPSRMDAALRRSLAHLVKSCEISVVHDGYTAFEAISAHPYDLIIIDFQLSGIDSLELIESVQYIDPGVPVILMIQKTHRSAKSVAGRAQPILTPFKPIKFLRMVDKLLHQQLNRYRQLADTLQTTLETLGTQTDTPCTFLAEEDGQVLIAYGELESELLARLGSLAVGISMLDEELERLFAQDVTLRAHYQAKKDHGLYVIPVTTTLHLALLSPLTAQTSTPEEIWVLMDKAALDVQEAFEYYSQRDSTPDDVSKTDVLRDHVFISLALENIDAELITETVEPEANYTSADEEDIAVNWQILADNSNLLTRLQNLTRRD